MRILQDGIILCGPKKKTIVVGHREYVKSQTCVCVWERACVERVRGSLQVPGGLLSSAVKRILAFMHYSLSRGRLIHCYALYTACYNEYNCLITGKKFYFRLSQKVGLHFAPPHPMIQPHIFLIRESIVPWIMQYICKSKFY